MTAPMDDAARRIKERLDTAETVLACATDIGNSWAREACVMEARTAYELGGLIDRLWASISRDQARLREQNAALATRLARVEGALRMAHACATVRDDGSCDGCFVSAALTPDAP